jgi:transposase
MAVSCAALRSAGNKRQSPVSKPIDILDGHADHRRLQQIPGIGPINALTILANAGDLRRFRHHHQFLKFGGLDLATHQSGQFRGRTKVSERGNARLRRTF